MAKKVKNLFKKIGKTYLKGTEMLYKPLIESGVYSIM